MLLAGPQDNSCSTALISRHRYPASLAARRTTRRPRYTARLAAAADAFLNQRFADWCESYWDGKGETYGHSQL